MATLGLIRFHHVSVWAHGVTGLCSLNTLLKFTTASLVVQQNGCIRCGIWEILGRVLVSLAIFTFGFDKIKKTEMCLVLGLISPNSNMNKTIVLFMLDCMWHRYWLVYGEGKRITEGVYYRNFYKIVIHSRNCSTSPIRPHSNRSATRLPYKTLTEIMHI